MSGSLRSMIFVVFLFLTVIGMVWCADDHPEPDREIIRPEGWGEETHGDNVDANYDLVFEEGVVHRLDLTIAHSDWQAMLGNMTFLYGEFGQGATYAIYNENSFDKEINADEADYSDVESLYEALHADRERAETWRAGLESVFNVSGFIRWLAVNTVIQNWDTYGRMFHNYYLYNDPATGLLNWIPWDNNEALRGSDQQMRSTLSMALTEVTDGWPLIRYLMDDPVYYDMYAGEIFETVTYVFYPEYMQPIYEAAHELIRPYVVGAEGEVPHHTLLSSPEAFETDLTCLDTHVEERCAEAMTFLSAPYAY